MDTPLKNILTLWLKNLETQSFATYIGNGVAIPHGMSEGSKYVKNTGISVIQIPDGVEWNEEKAYIVVGIAAIQMII